jgi:N-acetylneuraminic acid mutarotase
MKKLAVLFCITFFALALPAAEHKWDPLPLAVANNAVAMAKVDKRLYLFSFMGIGEKKTWKDVTNRAFMLNTEDGRWTEIRPVPGPAGRLAASAIAVKDVVYLLGGYTLDSRGVITSGRTMEVLLPSRGIWYRGADMPTPLDDTVVGVYRDRYIYTVSGWSQTETVASVQIYDTEKDKWHQATPIPGNPVFGHAGALVGDTIVYVDGAYKNPSANPQYIASEECWMGKIDRHDPTKIQWTKLPSHPGKARFRIAAGGSERDQKIYFSGGSEDLHNYAGIGYDGHPSDPVAMTFAWNLRTSKWEVVSENTPNPTMDNRGLLVTPESIVRIGGMEKDQKISTRLAVLPRK